MEGFKKTPKIACFKEGGQVGYKPRKTASDKKDIKQDKAVVKKAVGQHEAVKHKGEGKTELKLKSGGRCKKEDGTVKKYKKGGEVKKTPKKMNDGGLAATMAANPTAVPMASTRNRGIRGGNRNAPIRRTTHGNAASRPINQLGTPTQVTPGPTQVTPGPTSVTPGPTSVTPGPTSVTPGPTQVTPGPTSFTPGPTQVTPVPTQVEQTMVGENPMSGQFAAMKRGGKTKGKKK